MVGLQYRQGGRPVAPCARAGQVLTVVRALFPLYRRGARRAGRFRSPPWPRAVLTYASVGAPEPSRQDATRWGSLATTGLPTG